MIKTQKKFSNEPPVDPKSSVSSAVRAVIVNICCFFISTGSLEWQIPYTLFYCMHSSKLTVRSL